MLAPFVSEVSVNLGSVFIGTDIVKVGGKQAYGAAFGFQAAPFETDGALPVGLYGSSPK